MTWIYVFYKLLVARPPRNPYSGASSILIEYLETLRVLGWLTVLDLLIVIAILFFVFLR